MAGRNTQYDMTFLTARRVYREDITAADADVSSDAIPNIRLDIDPSKLSYDGAVRDPDQMEAEYEVSGRAYNGHLELFVYYTPDTEVCEDAGNAGLVDGVLSEDDDTCHADIRVYAWGGSQVSDDTLAGRWTLYYEQSVLTDTLMVLRNVPNTLYRVVVSYINGGEVAILEQHTV